MRGTTPRIKASCPVPRISALASSLLQLDAGNRAAVRWISVRGHNAFLAGAIHIGITPLSGALLSYFRVEGAQARPFSSFPPIPIPPPAPSTRPSTGDGAPPALDLPSTAAAYPAAPALDHPSHPFSCPGSALLRPTPAGLHASVVGGEGSDPGWTSCSCSLLQASSALLHCSTTSTSSISSLVSSIVSLFSMFGNCCSGLMWL